MSVCMSCIYMFYVYKCNVWYIYICICICVYIIHLCRICPICAILVDLKPGLLLQNRAWYMKKGELLPVKTKPGEGK